MNQTLSCNIASVDQITESKLTDLIPTSIIHHFRQVYRTINALMRHMNWIMKIMNALPESWAMQMGPEMASFIVLKKVGRYILYCAAEVNI